MCARLTTRYVGREGGARAVGRPTTDGDGGDAAVAQMYLKKTDRQEKVILAGRRWNVTGTLAPLPRRHQHGLGRQMREILAVVHPSMESVERARMAWIDEREPALHGRLPMAPSLTVLSGWCWSSIHGSSMSALHQAPSRTGRAAAATAPPPEPPPPASPAPPPPARAPRQRGTPPEAQEPANGGGPHPPGARQSRSSRCAAREIDGARQWLRGPSGSVASGAPPPGLCLPGHPRRGTWRRLERQPQRAPNGPKLSRVGALLHPTLAPAPSHPPVRHENTPSNSVPEGTSVTVAGWLRLLVPPRDCPATPPSTHRLPGTLALSLFPLPTLSLSLSSPILLSEKPRANAPTPFPPDDVTFAPPPRPSSVRHVDTDTRRPVRQHSHSSAAERVPTTTATLAPCPPASRSLALRLAVPIVPPAVPPRLRVAPLSTAAPTTTYTPGRRNRPISRTTASLHREPSCTTSATTLRLRRLLSHVPAPDAVAN
ncbi:hypothetical protein PCL_08153 [Purpureocillium lilacinum]|uniref:Uncharacterized protein n=1 Tax=Purpureocillium lilacinum TaxID=33203 RepID=A0A2U3EK09_PURLI|nr:hypothetical protein PCL_08153 [Purpureocillium lilacinum]